MPVQFDSDNPIIQDQPIANRSEGLEAIARTAGAVSHEAMDAAGSIGEQESNAMYASSQAQLDTLKTQAKIQIIQNPGQAKQIAESTAKNYAQITNEAVVNPSDRRKLHLSAATDFNDIVLDAARTEAGVVKKGAAVSFYTQFPQMLSGIKESIGNQKEFDNRLDSANQLIGSMIMSGAITPKQGETAYKALHHTISAAQAYMGAALDRDTSAKDYHRVKGGIVSVDDGTHMNQPVDHNTRHVYEAHNNDVTIDTLKSDIANGSAGNPMAWASLSDHQLNFITAYSQGAASVKADVNAGVPFTELQAELKRYQATGTLSSDQEGRQAAIKHMLSDTGGNSFQQVMAGNPLYREAEFNYNQTVAAIHNNANLSPQQQGELIKSYDNDLTWKKVNLARAQHMPDNLIQPLDPTFVAPTLAAWGRDADPTQLITRTDYMQRGLKEYMAQAQKTPLQQETTRVVGALQNGTRLSNDPSSLSGMLFGHSEKVTDQDRKDIVLANQTNRSFSDLKLGLHGTSDEALRVQIGKNLPKTLGFLSSQPQGQTRSAAAVTAVLNLTKFYAQQAGDVEMKNRDAYVMKATSMVNAAYPQEKGSNWRINTNDIPVSGWKMDVIASHLIDQTVKQMMEGSDPALIRSQLDSNSLSVTSTPTGELMVVDSYGSPLYKTPYRGTLLHYATHTMKTEEEERTAKLSSSIPKRGTENSPQDQVEQQNEEVKDEMEETDKMRAKGKKQHDKLIRAMKKAKGE